MTAPFIPPADDSSVQMLRAVFGKIIDGLTGLPSAVVESPQATMLAAAFEYFNSGILFFGSILLTWITLTGTTHTANDGEALVETGPLCGRQCGQLAQQAHLYL